MDLIRIHHVAIIVSDYERSKIFYTDILGLQIIKETYRKERDSYKLDLALHGNYCIELFSFPSPPDRMTNPEACGLRHLAFEVSSITDTVKNLERKGIHVEPVRIDDLTQKQFAFIKDPDGLPVEFYEL